MICENCRMAGAFNSTANTTAEPLKEPLQVEAGKWHQGCVDPIQCTCQHVVGQVINHAGFA